MDSGRFEGNKVYWFEYINCGRGKHFIRANSEEDAKNKMKILYPNAQFKYIGLEPSNMSQEDNQI